LGEAVPVAYPSKKTFTGVEGGIYHLIRWLPAPFESRPGFDFTLRFDSTTGTPDKCFVALYFLALSAFGLVRFV
jgi:hypothetical protein